MRTIQYDNTFSGAFSNEDVMEIKVQNNNSIAIHCVTTDATMVIKTRYVFTDPGTGAMVQEVDYDSATMAANTLQVFNYQYKVDHMKVVIFSSASSGTVRITANVTQS